MKTTKSATKPMLVFVSLFILLDLNSVTLAQDDISRKLNAVEIEGLVLIREEEKLAGDVYHTLYEKWGLKPFANIENSERSHMAAIKTLLDTYGIADPIKSNDIGVFNNKLMAKLYTDLTKKGLKSLDSALAVAAEIEELDIKDIHEYLEKASASDIKTTYQNLIKGSRNHLRTFNAQINKRGNTYEPTHISKEYFSKIISTKNENGSITVPDYKF